MYVPIILGTARIGRQSEKAAKYMLAQTKKYGFETELIDVRNFRIQATDNSKQSAEAKILNEIVKKSDGFIIVTPEYNHGYPGELKMMLDLLYEEYTGRVVGLCAVSIGPFGGTRVVEQLKPVMTELHMHPIRESIYFSKISDTFDENNNPFDKTLDDRVKKFLDELSIYAKALKETRKN
ncbi:MAG: NAD(P)H-dependent oxidoreductase [Patescibacteria group bacterium]|nr:NAD(P)H-dependent oxidoreductase [Patescibacteria group bacterium]